MRLLLRQKGYYTPQPENNINLVIEEQSSTNRVIMHYLAHASKQGTNGVGKPECIISNIYDENTILVIECKLYKKDHCSPTRVETAQYAVDGALHYAKNLHPRYDVIAIGISGDHENDLLISSFIWRRNQNNAYQLMDCEGEILTWSEYVRALHHQDDTYREIALWSADVLNDVTEYGGVDDTDFGTPLMVGWTPAFAPVKMERRVVGEFIKGDLQGKKLLIDSADLYYVEGYGETTKERVGKVEDLGYLRWYATSDRMNLRRTTGRIVTPKIIPDLLESPKDGLPEDLTAYLADTLEEPKKKRFWKR